MEIKTFETRNDYFRLIRNKKKKIILGKLSIDHLRMLLKFWVKVKGEERLKIR